jgi:hypothetical protein
MLTPCATVLLTTTTHTLSTSTRRTRPVSTMLSIRLFPFSLSSNDPIGDTVPVSVNKKYQYIGKEFLSDVNHWTSLITICQTYDSTSAKGSQVCTQHCSAPYQTRIYFLPLFASTKLRFTAIDCDIPSQDVWVWQGAEIFVYGQWWMLGEIKMRRGEIRAAYVPRDRSHRTILYIRSIEDAPEDFRGVVRLDLKGDHS